MELTLWGKVCSHDRITLDPGDAPNPSRKLSFSHPGICHNFATKKEHFTLGQINLSERYVYKHYNYRVKYDFN